MLDLAGKQKILLQYLTRKGAFMTLSQCIEIFGTFASVVVAISLMMKNAKRLRILNGLGAFLFVIYGAFIQSIPVFSLNLFVTIIDVYYFIQMIKMKDAFTIMPVAQLESDYVKRFVNFYKNDIAKFVPDFKLQDGPEYTGFFILRDMLPVSFVIFKKISEQDYEIMLDYAVPKYRDLQNARYFFDHISHYFAGSKHVNFKAYTDIKLHAKYLTTMGFAPSGEKRAEIAEYTKQI